MTFRRNLVAGLANSVWSAILSFAMVPVYLRYLGVESYGLIGFYGTLQTVLLLLLELGLSAAISREVARYSAASSLHEAASLVYTTAAVYWVTALLIGGVTILCAPHFATSWHDAKSLSPSSITNALMLMGIAAACRWPAAAYQGVLLGAQRMALASYVSMATITVSNLGVVAVLAFLSPTIEAFFIWQAMVGIVFTLWMRHAAWKIIGKPTRRFDPERLKAIWRFSAGVSVFTILVLLLSQMDKIVLSKMVSLEQFGQYTLAAVLVGGMDILKTPLYNLVYPRFSALAAAQQGEQLARLYHLSTRSLSTVIFPLATFLALFAEDIVGLWTGNRAIAADLRNVIALLAMGSAVRCIMYMPQALQLAHGITRLLVKIHALLLVVLVPLMIVLVQRFGMLGAAAAWLAIHLLYMLLSVWLMHKQILEGGGLDWLLRDCGVPAVLSLLAGGFVLYARSELGDSMPMKAISLGVLALPVAASIWLSVPLRGLFLASLKTGLPRHRS